MVHPDAHDFVDFVRNVGQPPDKHMGGGTFGYGKSAFYLASRARAVLVYTRCYWDGAPVSRFIACGLGDGYTASVSGTLRPFTGRHGWGRFADDGVLDPLEGDEADELARAFGLPGFGLADDLGTTIAVVAPNLGERSPADAMRFIAASITWNFWPKMLEDDSGEVAIQFSASSEGANIQVPHPTELPPLHGYADVMRRLRRARNRGGGLEGVDELWLQRPQQRLGHIALNRFAPRVRPSVECYGEGQPRGIRGRVAPRCLDAKRRVGRPVSVRA